MKKFMVIVVSILLGLFALSGCAMLDIGEGTGGTEGPGGGQTVEKTPLEVIAEKYAKLADAATVSQEIGVSQGELVQYASQKTYKKAGAGYQVTGTEKRLNPLSSGKAEPYTETSIETTVKAGAFAPRLELDELYFTNTKIENGTLEAKVMDSSVETVLGIAEDLPAPIHGLTLKIVTNDTHVTDMGITYASGESEIVITLKFTY